MIKVNPMPKKKNPGGRPKQKAEFHEGPNASRNFVDQMKRLVTVPKKQVVTPKSAK